MRRGIWFLLIVTVVLGIVFWSVGGSRVKDEAPYYLKDFIGQTAIITIKDRIIKAEVAITAKARTKGLAGREYIAPGKGMLFVFPAQEVYPFTMADTLIPLDIIWILDDRIVYIYHQAKPGEEYINPGVEANYVLEVMSRSAQTAGWQVGDIVDITFDK